MNNELILSRVLGFDKLRKAKNLIQDIPKFAKQFEEGAKTFKEGIDSIEPSIRKGVIKGSLVGGGLAGSLGFGLAKLSDRRKKKRR